jgi:LacI family repressor for deo operon, udp, cdd, tsx, nupC, and nupG
MSSILEVAQRAGVSTATVSRVTSGAWNVVAPETRRKVLRAVDQLGYVPNCAAKNLRTLRSRRLLVTLPDLSNPVFSAILQGIEDAAQRAGYGVLLGDTRNPPPPGRLRNGGPEGSRRVDPARSREPNAPARTAPRLGHR